jgi:tetrahydromethanopterin S-methyltransferase subunit E
MILRVLTVLFLAATIAAAAIDVLSQVGMASLGQVWFTLSPETLNLSQAVIQRYISPELWDPGIIWFLGQPATVVFGLIALAFFLATWLFGRRR